MNKPDFLASTNGYGAIRAVRKIWTQFLSALLLLSLPAHAQDVKIVALGDSLVHGYGLPADQGFVPQMQNWLRDRGVAVNLVNAGVSGDTTTGALARVDWVVAPDTDGLIVSLGGNDILRAIDPALSRENLSRILDKAAARGIPTLLVGINVPPNFGAQYQRDFQAIYTELSAEFGTELYPDFLQSLLRREDRARTYQELFQTDGLHPNAQGVAIIVQDMGPYVQNLAAKANAGN